MIDRLASSLRSEASRANERRAIVLAGDHDAAMRAAKSALSAAEIPASETTVVGPADGPSSAIPGEQSSLRETGDLMGRTRSAVVLDCHETFRPNALGRVVGAVDGGGLFVLLTPPLDAWADRPDGFDESLAVPPHTEPNVTGRVRQRVADLARAHSGIAVVNVDDGEIERDGSMDPAPRCQTSPPTRPQNTRFPPAIDDACLTDDQVDVVTAFEGLGDDHQRALVVEADRGRGKSSAAGLAAAALAHEGDRVLVTAPGYRNAREALVRAVDALETLGTTPDVDDRNDPHRIRSEVGAIEFVSPDEGVERAPSSDLLIVDEAAGFPVARLEKFLGADSVAFLTTVHGYEGAGRGFSVRFRERLAAADHEVVDVTMAAPIRYADTDPIEPWAFRALLLDASPAVEQLIEDATPASVAYERLDPDRLLGDEHLLREAFGLLVLAHYRTEPDDIARLLDAPNVSARALLHDGHVASVALLAREGDLPADRRADMYEGGRVRGNMIPDVLTTQLRDEDAGVPVGQRVLRIATHPAVRSRGLGSRLLDEIHTEMAGDVDWLGVGFGATPDLVDFWADNGFRTAHCSIRRNDESGEYSAIMLDHCSAAGGDVLARHTDWFLDRIGSVLTDALGDLDPDVARAILRATDGRPSIDLTDAEWRLVAGVPGGASTLDTDPDPFRRLVLRHLVAPGDVGALTSRVERILVAKVLQARPWTVVAEDHEFVSTAECMRAVGEAIERLVDLYGTEFARAELERHR
jgi:tRNA(Met) cytidine acetyltransferase